MGEEKYVLNCPKCGRVEGIVPTGDEEDETTAEADVVIEREVVQTPAGISQRVRCPRCGKWIKADRVGPA